MIRWEIKRTKEDNIEEPLPGAPAPPVLGLVRCAQNNHGFGHNPEVQSTDWAFGVQFRSQFYITPQFQ